MTLFDKAKLYAFFALTLVSCSFSGRGRPLEILVVTGNSAGKSVGLYRGMLEKVPGQAFKSETYSNVGLTQITSDRLTASSVQLKGPESSNSERQTRQNQQVFQKRLLREYDLMQAKSKPSPGLQSDIFGGIRQIAAQHPKNEPVDLIVISHGFHQASNVNFRDARLINNSKQQQKLIQKLLSDRVELKGLRLCFVGISNEKDPGDQRPSGPGMTNTVETIWQTVMKQSGGTVVYYGHDDLKQCFKALNEPIVVP
jgi:hypothetical protein